jgi:hypothetical protein
MQSIHCKVTKVAFFSVKAKGGKAWGWKSIDALTQVIIVVKAIELHEEKRGGYANEV